MCYSTLLFLECWRLIFVDKIRELTEVKKSHESSFCSKMFEKLVNYSFAEQLASIFADFQCDIYDWLNYWSFEHVYYYLGYNLASFYHQNQYHSFLVMDWYLNISNMKTFWQDHVVVSMNHIFMVVFQCTFIFCG